MPFPGPNIESNVLTASAILPGAGRLLTPIYLALAQVVAADVIAMPMTFRGRLVAMDFAVQSKVTTAGKAATLTARVRSGGVTTNMTGGVVALTSALATPEAAVIPGTAITGLNAFRSGDQLVVTASAVTAFSEGTGYLMLTLVNDDFLGSLERIGMLFPSSG